MIQSHVKSAGAAATPGDASLVLLRERPDEGWSRLRQWWPGMAGLTGHGCRIAAHPGGDLTLVSAESGRLTRVDAAGEVVTARAGAEARLVGPRAVCADDPDGAFCWVADPVGERLVRLDAALRVERTLALLPGCFGPGSLGVLGAPAAVAARDGLLLVADSRHAVGGLARFTADGDWLGAVALSPSGRCGVPQPSVAALSADGIAWAISGLNGRLYRIADDAAAPIGGPAAGPTLAATGIAVDGDDRVHVAVADFGRSARHRIVHLDASGAVLGVTRLVRGLRPLAIAAAAGMLWVNDQRGDLFGFALPAAANARAA